jgi:DNA polymerase elongation subunit (family B)
MAHYTGWILDVSIERDRVIIWIKTTEGKSLKLADAYQPNFYILPKDEFGGAELFQILSQEANVAKVEWEKKFTDLFNLETGGFKKLISVYSETIFSHKTLLHRLENDTRVAQLFNNDLSHVQRYLFTTLKIDPTSKVEVEYDDDTSYLIRINKINENEIAPPPFSILYFDVPDSDEDQVRQIRARYQEEHEVSFEGDEENLLKGFRDFIVAKDPDIIVFVNPRFENTVFDCLFNRMNILGLDLSR